VYSVADGETGGAFTWDGVWNVVGEGFTGTAPGWFVEYAVVNTSSEDETDWFRNHDVADAESMDLDAEDRERPTAGDYPDARLRLGIAREEGGKLVSEPLVIPIHLVVGE
jgi:hypothetical protein